MSALTRTGSILALAAVAVIAGQSDAGAHKIGRHHHHYRHVTHKGTVCKVRLEGGATGQGLFGAGTAAARAAAQSDWESKAAAKYGEKFASLSKASLVRWDCKKNAILKAKCVVTARPCG
jgi:hypothetical protein